MPPLREEARCAKKPAATVDAIPPHPLPPAIPNWVLEAICVTSADVTSADVTSAVRVALRRRTDMVMQASMWVLGVMSRCRCRG